MALLQPPQSGRHTDTRSDYVITLALGTRLADVLGMLQTKLVHLACFALGLGVSVAIGAVVHASEAYEPSTIAIRFDAPPPAPTTTTSELGSSNSPSTDSAESDSADTNRASARTSLADEIVTAEASELTSARRLAEPLGQHAQRRAETTPDNHPSPVAPARHRAPRRATTRSTESAAPESSVPTTTEQHPVAASERAQVARPHRPWWTGSRTDAEGSEEAAALSKRRGYERRRRSAHTLLQPHPERPVASGNDIGAATETIGTLTALGSSFR